MTIRNHFASSLALLLVVGLVDRATAAPGRTLASELPHLAKDIRDALTSDPKLKGGLSIGGFNGPQLKNSNFGLSIGRQLSQLLTTLVRDEADLVLVGRYDYVPSETDTAEDARDEKLQVIRIVASVENKQARQLATFSVEINDTDDIDLITGGTNAAPLHGGQKARNESAKKAFQNPGFAIKDRTRVAVNEKSPYAVEILVKDKLNGIAHPIEPANQKGRAFVDVKPDQFYELRLYNDENFEAAASITIDGLDAINTFNKDKQQYGPYIIPPKGSVLVRGWFQTATPKKKATDLDNMLAFQVTELGHGAATALKSPGEIGVITVGFHAAWKPNDKPPESEKGVRSVGRETKAGPGFDEKIEVVSRHIGLKRATVSIRYSPNP